MLGFSLAGSQLRPRGARVPGVHSIFCRFSLFNELPKERTRFYDPSCAESFSGRFQAATNVRMLPKTKSKLTALHRFFIFLSLVWESAGGNQTLFFQMHAACIQ
jgi:hypothetical protein